MWYYKIANITFISTYSVTYKRSQSISCFRNRALEILFLEFEVWVVLQQSRPFCPGTTKSDDSRDLPSPVPCHWQWVTVSTQRRQTKVNTWYTSSEYSPSLQWFVLPLTHKVAICICIFYSLWWISASKNVYSRFQIHVCCLYPQCPVGRSFGLCVKRQLLVPSLSNWS